MDFAVLQAVRDRLQGYAPLLDYFAQHYPYSTLRFFVGLKPSLKDGTAMPTDFFPYIAIGPLRYASGPDGDNNINNTISIMYGVYDDREVNGECLGVKAICDITQLIVKALEKQPLSVGKVFGGAVDVQFEAGVMFPYHEAELLPIIETRRD